VGTRYGGGAFMRPSGCMQVLQERAAWDWLKREGGATQLSVVLPVSARETGCP